jgi:hypothetical protein
MTWVRRDARITSAHDELGDCRGTAPERGLRLELRFLGHVGGFGEELEDFLQRGALLAVGFLFLQQGGDVGADCVDAGGEVEAGHGGLLETEMPGAGPGISDHERV